MAAEKITVSWDEISSSDVDARLAEEQRATDDASEASTQPAMAGAARYDVSPSDARWWLKTPVYMAAFGLLGGLIGWAFGLLVYAGPDPVRQADKYAESYRRVVAAFDQGKIAQPQSDAALKRLRNEAGKNPYFDIAVNPALTDTERADQRAALVERDRLKQHVGDALFYSASALAIAMCLAAAESVVSRNWVGALVNASIGACVGLVGGVVVSLFVGELFESVRALGGATPSIAYDMFARAVSWGLLGLFMGMAPGAVMRNSRKILIGAAGGLVGGVLGGLVFDPVAGFTENEIISRLIAIGAIGLLAGAGTGLIEEAAKLGWLKVTEGLIAGKQFILYRNPTFIGNSLSAHIYLFKDPQVGRRHAAIHVLPGGYEIEDLPLGSRTIVNGKPVRRARLKHGDRIKIGKTSLLFQEKNRTPGEY